MATASEISDLTDEIESVRDDIWIGVDEATWCDETKAVMEQYGQRIAKVCEAMRAMAAEKSTNNELPMEFAVKLVGERVSELRFQNREDAEKFAKLAMQKDEQNKIKPTRFELFEEVCV